MAIPAGLPFPALVIHCPSSETFERSATTTTSAEEAHGNTEHNVLHNSQFPLVAETDGRASLRPLLCCRRLATIDWEWYLQMPSKPGWF